MEKSILNFHFYYWTPPLIEMAKGQGNHFEMSRAGGWRISLFRNLLHKRFLTSLLLSGGRCVVQKEKNHAKPARKSGGVVEILQMTGRLLIPNHEITLQHKRLFPFFH